MIKPVPPKGQLVLIDSARHGPEQADGRAVTADASCHGDTAPSTPSRRRAAAAHAPTTSTASANTLGWPGSGPVSGSSCTSNAVNTERTTSALRVNARSQPRTVDAGRPSRVGDRPMPGTGRLHPQRRTDHLDPVGPAQQARHRQQHMRHQAAAAPGATWPQLTDPADRPLPGMPPRSETTAARASQLTSPQTSFDLDRRPYLP